MTKQPATLLRNGSPSPLPLTVGTRDADTGGIFIRGNRPGNIACVYGADASSYAAYIVHACNAYSKLVETLRALMPLLDQVPVFQLDGGKSSVKAVRLAGQFMAATKTAHAILSELGEDV